MAAVRERQRKNILDNATAVFLEKGMFDTSMETIARRSGVTRRTLYRYFETREELAYEVLIGLMEDWNRVHRDIFACLHGPGIEKLKQFLYGLIDHMKDRRDFMRFTGEFDFYFKDDSEYKPDGQLMDRLGKNIHLSEDLIETILREGIKDRSIDADEDVRLLVYTITNVLWSYGQRIAIRGAGLKEEFGIDPMEMILCQVDLYVKGLKKSV